MNGNRSSHCAAAGAVTPMTPIVAAAASARPSSTKAVNLAKRNLIGPSNTTSREAPATGHQPRKNVSLKMRLAAQPLENRHRREAIRRQAVARLEIAYRRPCFQPKTAARL